MYVFWAWLSVVVLLSFGVLSGYKLLVRLSATRKISTREPEGGGGGGGGHIKQKLI